MKLYTIRDSKAACYFTPQAFRTRGEAIRALQTQVKNSESMLSKYPLDYSFHEIGEWDDLTGQIIPFESPENLGLVADLAIRE